jgi:hypothetical protein
MSGQEDAHGRTAPFGTGNLNFTAMRLHKLMANRQSEASSRRFRRKEGIEDSTHNIGGNALSCIVEFHASLGPIL